MQNIVNQTDIAQLIARDKLFGLINEKYGPPPNWTRPQGFTSLSRIILEQQVSLESANAHFLKLNEYVKEFIPEKINRLNDEEMRSCQISRQKSKYLRALSGEILNGNLILEDLPGLTQSEIKGKLTCIKGIGDWSADIYLMFCLQSRDIFPVGDIAVITTVRELCDLKTKEEIIRMSHNWKPHRSLATYYLWHYYLTKRNRNSPIRNLST